MSTAIRRETSEGGFCRRVLLVALTNSADSRYQDAVAIDSTIADATILTTDEVLTEFLTYFAEDAWLRNRAARTVQELLKDPDVLVVPQSRESF